MRDLYARLSLPPGASDAQIKAAIKACPHAELRSDAAAVLLHAVRRREYDELHATLVRIGSLRASLGLVQTRLWRDEREFNGEVTGTGSRYGEFMQKRNMIAATRRVENAAPKHPSFLKKLNLLLGLETEPELRKPQAASRKPQAASRKPQTI